MRDRVAEIKKIVNSNEFWVLSTGEHQNMIDILLEYIEELEKSKSGVKASRMAAAGCKRYERGER